jgi:hypothetical protein
VKAGEPRPLGVNLILREPRELAVRPGEILNRRPEFNPTGKCCVRPCDPPEVGRTVRDQSHGLEPLLIHASLNPADVQSLEWKPDGREHCLVLTVDGVPGGGTLPAERLERGSE